MVIYWILQIWAAPIENVSAGICGQRRPRSDCASPQSDQGLHYPLTIIGYYKMYEWRANARMILCACAGYFCAFCACSKALFCLTRSIRSYQAKAIKNIPHDTFAIAKKSIIFASHYCLLQLITLGTNFMPVNNESLANWIKCLEVFILNQ